MKKGKQREAKKAKETKLAKDNGIKTNESTHEKLINPLCI